MDESYRPKTKRSGERHNREVNLTSTFVRKVSETVTLTHSGGMTLGEYIDGAIQNNLQERLTDPTKERLSEVTVQIPE